MSDEVPDHYRPRLCHVVKWDDFQGYGFNLHAEKGKAGQFIGTVDENSPAEASGLKEGDRIIEVNGINIGNENHQQVVTRIKSGGEETRLLVVDSESDEWYKKNKKIIRGDLPEVRFGTAKRDSNAYDIADEPVLPSDHGQEPDHGHADDEDNKQHEHPQPDSDNEDIISSSSTAPVSNGNGVNEHDSYRPRLCHLKLWPHFQGYGFNLHAEKDKPGQYIGLVDDNSPSSTAGLLVNDRIIEVNGVNVEQEKHTDVIARIKAIPGETKLLVVDKATDNYYKEKGITVTSSMLQTQHLITPDAANLPVQAEESEVVAAEAFPDVVPDLEAVHDLDTVEHENHHVKEDYQEVEETYTKVDHDEVVKQESIERVEVEKVEHQLSVTSLEEDENKHEKPEDAVNGLKSSVQHTASEPEHEFTVAPHVRPEPAVASAPASKPEGLELNLSVAEMKERLKSKKRQDPRMSKVPFDQKYKEFQRM